MDGRKSDLAPRSGRSAYGPQVATDLLSELFFSGSEWGSLSPTLLAKANERRSAGCAKSCEAIRSLDDRVQLRPVQAEEASNFHANIIA